MLYQPQLQRGTQRPRWSRIPRTGWKRLRPSGTRPGWRKAASVSVLILPRDPHLKKAIGYGVHLCPAFYMISDHLKSQKMPYGILHRTWGLERMPLDKRNRRHFRCLYIFGYRNQSLFLGIIQQGQLCQE